MAFAYRGLGLIAQAQGEHLQAVEMFNKSLDALTEDGTRQDETHVLVEMSHSIFTLRNDAEAERGWYKALCITTETQSTFVALEALVGIAMLKAKQGNIERGFELSSIVLDLPASLQETKDRAEQLCTKLTAGLEPQTVKITHEAFASESFDEIVGELLASN